MHNMTLLIGSIAVLMLLGLGAFFSAAETAMTALSQIDVSSLKEQHEKVGKQIENLLGDRSRLIAALLIGNNIANISASALVAYITDVYFGGIAIVLATFILTFLVIVFSEIAPKQLALLYKRKTAIICISPVWFFYRIFSVILDIILQLSKIILSRFKGEPEENLEESLEHMVELAFENKDIEDYERNFINNILELKDKTARQIMTHRKNIFSVADSARLRDIYPSMVEHNYSRVPVYHKNKENIVGVLPLSKLQKFHRELHFGQPLEPEDAAADIAQTVKHLMEPVEMCPDSKKVSELFSYFKDHKGNLVIILDEHGSLSGVVSQEDVLEAVFGELYDEDELALDIPQEGEKYLIPGNLSIQQFEEHFEIEIEPEQKSRLATISGYICRLEGSIPKQGKDIKLPEGTYRVEECDGKRIVTLSFIPK